MTVVKNVQAVSNKETDAQSKSKVNPWVEAQDSDTSDLKKELRKWPEQLKAASNTCSYCCFPCNGAALDPTVNLKQNSIVLPCARYAPCLTRAHSCSMGGERLPKDASSTQANDKSSCGIPGIALLNKCAWGVPAQLMNLSKAPCVGYQSGVKLPVVCTRETLCPDMKYWCNVRW
ncbi:hypothetical protein TNIN_125991 [Trichonephila inaurata madagascariensis]|uniref:Uncharacterized protein n=1 Tax=Trichonephila inaurata madagascariensis TaxID=2747483 RepID=A0A8X7CGU3_9ARAC|nr:hypothetical protein TNIN_125991 [Trichonephila inaurata madagascariensis]